ncbi:MAG: fumarylacetoacetate hydrolase family protein [Bacteroidota bacterium]|uniref:Fumarylacetoacetate hydrolase family protein n=1 Tax=Flagellimonas profundi TaxID=2915620 RepID=A0ABS3FHR3_9FLAO|nr:fumarylacetoacetate hydrolase family protein [Allomuricauda profundi]MBO0342718.1 fumarylacetoacetate hydrolase family protein [Allomuricauda profundi]MEC7769657.1 fumarylacetoacetate hydrolase family protein [Bacteroidota bacterium]
MKLICIGRNYVDHINELSNERPDEPVVFIKPDSAILPKEQDFYIPEFSKDVHYEVEVLVKIKKVGKHISREFAHKYYDEIGLGIDFTARDLQSKLKSKGLPWEKAKGFDGAAVVGKWVPKDKFSDLDNLNFSLSKNGETVQEGNTSLMLWKIDEIISHVSTYFMLKKGDIIFTGTPAGVGKVSPNDYLVGTLEGEQLFDINVK